MLFRGHLRMAACVPEVDGQESFGAPRKRRTSDSERVQTGGIWLSLVPIHKQDCQSGEWCIVGADFFTWGE